MSVENLVKENNRKRKLLTEANEKYYTDLLVYIRLQWRLSEQQSEEILMDMLDHLLDGQDEGKTAEEIFGDDPFAFADELIQEITHERPRNILLFLAGIGIHLLGLVLIIRSLVVFALSFFFEVNTEVNLFHVTVTGASICLFIFFNVYFILRTVKKDLFTEQESSQLKQMSKTGFVAAASMLIVLLIVKFTPNFGPSIPLSPVLSLVIGIVILISYYSVKRLRNK